MAKVGSFYFPRITPTPELTLIVIQLSTNRLACRKQLFLKSIRHVANRLSFFFSFSLSLSLTTHTKLKTITNLIEEKREESEITYVEYTGATQIKKRENDSIYWETKKVQNKTRADMIMINEKKVVFCIKMVYYFYKPTICEKLCITLSCFLLKRTI